MGFEVVVVRGWGWGGGPEDWVVVRKEGKDYAEEEACCCCFVSCGVMIECYLGVTGDARQTIRKVAKDPMLIIAMEGVVARGW